ncbi:trypco2 family protein [Streptomyces sp. URMC 126]|uniref:trypco2 family protein n=1 Tax=Streptomyces sp. URMC 126 TaxID=3423401 RepID=UPI003F1C4FE4
MEIELAAAVAALRDELTEAAASGSGQEIRFRVGPIELEFAVEIRQDVRAKAGFRVWVVSGDGEAGAVRGRTHRVKVALTPEGLDGDVLIHRRRLTEPGPGDVSGRIGN